MRVNAELIRKNRQNRSWSQEELAIATGLNLRTIQRIENTGSASLQSRKALAAVFGVAVDDLSLRGARLRPCPECGADKVYQCTDQVDTTTIGGELLPKISPRRFSSAKMTVIVCRACGYLRNFVEPDALAKIKDAENWRLLR
ncbi:MAG: helix-turn-helix transcriptional regulator [Pseudomonadota bacterium]